MRGYEEKAMNSKRVWWSLMMSLLMVALVSSLAFAQTAMKPGPAGQPPEGPKVAIEGKILYMKSFGGYIVVSETPHEEYKIINENAKVLGDLATKGNPVTIEGRLPRGAYLLFIDKIDGKTYKEAK